MKRLIALSLVLVTVFATPVFAMGRGINRASNMNYTATNYNQAIDSEALITARKAYLDSLVDQGVLTQSNADAMLANYSIMLENRIAYGGYGGPCCGGFGPY